MYIRFDGGLCCGVKIIAGLGATPDLTFCSVEARDDFKGMSNSHEGFERCIDYEEYYNRSPFDPTLAEEPFLSTEHFFNKSAPEETGENRLKRFIEFIREYQPECLVRIVLVPFQSSWEPVLKKNKFKKVSEWKNSNTGRILKEYHLIIKKED